MLIILLGKIMYTFLGEIAIVLTKILTLLDYNFKGNGEGHYYTHIYIYIKYIHIQRHFFVICSAYFMY